MTKRSDCKHQPSARHYELVGPARMTAGSYILCEPPEEYCAWAMVIAKNKNEARKHVTKEADFRDYVTEMRGDDKPPWYEVKVRESVCEHGVCWECGECIDCLVHMDEDGFMESGPAPLS
jgi:hypothetical protein